MSVSAPKCAKHDVLQPCGECLRDAGQSFVGNFDSHGPAAPAPLDHNYGNTWFDFGDDGKRTDGLAVGVEAEHSPVHPHYLCFVPYEGEDASAAIKVAETISRALNAVARGGAGSPEPPSKLDDECPTCGAPVIYTPPHSNHVQGDMPEEWLYTGAVQAERPRAPSQSWLPDTFVERVYQKAQNWPAGNDSLVKLTAFEASAIRQRALQGAPTEETKP